MRCGAGSATMGCDQRQSSVPEEYYGSVRSVGDIHSIFFVPDNLEHEGSLLLLQPLYTALLVHEIGVGTAKVVDVDLLCLSFTRQNLSARY